MTKKELAEKIAKEQNLDATKLMRLTVAELEKMDLVVADEEVDIFEGAELEEESDESGEAGNDSQEEDPSDDMVEEAKDPVEGRELRLVGHHPITKKPVYR